eukprot:243231_1
MMFFSPISIATQHRETLKVTVIMQSTQLFIIFITLTLFYTCLCDPPPPILPNGFTINGTHAWGQILHNGTVIIAAKSTKIEYYDYNNKRGRFDYGDGNADITCINVYPSKACNLYFDESSALFAYFPFNDYCCLACPPGEYCTIVKPNWIADGTYDGLININNRSCNYWNKLGVTTMDYWAQDNNTVPCSLWMENNSTLEYQYILYDPNSYIVGQPNSDLFVLPQKCQEKHLRSCR